MKSAPLLSKYMSTTPHSIGADQTLRSAYDLMKKQGIRHLPVLRDGQLCGVVSDRDLKLALGLNGVDPDRTTVDEVAIEDVYLVRTDARIDEVARTMAERKVGSAIVVDNHKLVGIFTTTDALIALGELLQRHST